MFWAKIFECLEISIFLVLRALSCQINFVELSYGDSPPFNKIMSLIQTSPNAPHF